MSETVIVAGVGPGLGLAVAKRFAAAGARVAMLARRPEALQGFAAADPERLKPYACDLTDPAAVTATFAAVAADLGVPDCVVFNAGAFVRAPIAEIAPADFERCWRVGAFSGFLVGQAAAKAMLPRGRGTILFTGATASLRGGANFANLASPKFALRALVQSLAREVMPQGIHVAHIIIDGGIGEDDDRDARLRPDAIAETYYALHTQHRSAWSQEVDLRPWVERF